MQFLVDFLAVLLVNVLENILAEFFDFPNDVPRLVFLDVFVDIVENPRQFLAIRVKAFDEVSDGLLFDLRVVEFDAQVGCEVEFAGEVSQHALEKRVDGFHAEIAVVVQQVVEGDGGSLAHKFGIVSRLLRDDVDVVLRFAVVAVVADAVELRQNAHFHLFGCLVGERHGEDAAVGRRVFHQQFDVIDSKPERFSRTGAGFIDSQGDFHFIPDISSGCGRCPSRAAWRCSFREFGAHARGSDRGGRRFPQGPFRGIQCRNTRG